MSLEFNGIKLLPISELQVSQIYLNRRKIDEIYKWFRPEDVNNYEPLPVHDFGDGKYTLTDGHSRAYVAFKAGVKHIPVVYDNDDIVVSKSGLLHYSHNLLWCQRFKVITVTDFDDRIVSDAQYKELWIERCDKSYNLLSQTTEAERNILAKKQESLFLFGANEDLSVLYFENENGNIFAIKKECNIKPVLTDNAFEAWTAAIRFCDAILDGKATLQYQKSFVSSLHNAVELIMKQMLLNNNNHTVAEIKKVKNKEEASLQLEYYKSTNLNHFFAELPEDKLLMFTSIQFNDLISLHKKLLGNSLTGTESIVSDLKLLQQLRNNETHFLIRYDSFLSEEDFCRLHNFMIKFYSIMWKWTPTSKEDYEMYILPYWGDPEGADSIYGFERKPLKDFSYESAVRNSALANKIAELLKTNCKCGAPNFSPYTITKDLINKHSDLTPQFEEIWAMVSMMQRFNIIKTEEILYKNQDIGDIRLKISF